MTTQYFTGSNIHRVTTYNNGAFVSVDVYASAHATAPAWSKLFAAGDTDKLSLFAARSNAAMYVAKITDSMVEGKARPDCVATV